MSSNPASGMLALPDQLANLAQGGSGCLWRYSISHLMAKLDVKLCKDCAQRMTFTLFGTFSVGCVSGLWFALTFTWAFETQFLNLYNSANAAYAGFSAFVQSCLCGLQCLTGRGHSVDWPIGPCWVKTSASV